MDFQFELGDTLHKVLRKFPDKQLCPENIISEKIDGEIATEIFFALYKREYIKSVEHKEFETADDIELGDFFRIAVEGRDFLELHTVWWSRFWVRSIVCPIVVSFITALNAAPAWRVLKKILLSSLTP